MVFWLRTNSVLKLVVIPGAGGSGTTFSIKIIQLYKTSLSLYAFRIQNIIVPVK